jgi:hypothetical protein
MSRLWSEQEVDEAIDELLCHANEYICGDYSVHVANDLAFLAWLAVELVVPAERLDGLPITLEAAGLLLDGWLPGDRVVKKRKRHHEGLV